MKIISSEKKNKIDLKINNMLSRLDMQCPKNSPLDIAKGLGIEVYIVDFDKIPEGKGVSSIIDKEGKIHRIYLNKKHSKTQQTFTLAHALGHYTLHDFPKYRINKYC